MTAREPGATSPTAGTRTAAQEIVAALALPASATAAEPTRPLPLTGLRQLCRDTTMLYDAGRAGRIRKDLEPRHHPRSRLAARRQT